MVYDSVGVQDASRPPETQGRRPGGQNRQQQVATDGMHTSLLRVKDNVHRFVYRNVQQEGHMSRLERSHLRIVRDPEPLGSYIRPISLRMHAFGSTSSGRLNLRRYVKAARRLHAVGLPVIGERTGTVGLALMALGCVAGIESSVTHGERCDIRTLQREPRPGRPGFAPPLRVYLPGIGAFLNREPAAEVHELAAVPVDLRTDHYMTSWLRPASDRAIRAARILPQLAKQRKRLDDWRETLSEIRSADAAERPSVSPSIARMEGPSPRRTGSTGS